ncbi:MAG TPA: hemerythrin domain-containing protein [Nocardioides sp.]|nr:hemerythrin domain-containing protein [Nocardioides sp.]
MTTTKNVVDLLTDQHRHIEKLFDEVQSTAGQARSRAFDELRRMLSVHEAAEEIVTHPNVTRHGGGDVVEARQEEELEFPVLLAETEPAQLEKMGAAVQAVERIAPTHPHPRAGESAIVNAAVGQLAALLDKVRDAARSAMR